MGTAALQLDEAVIGYQSGKAVLVMPTNAGQIKMLEVGEMATLEGDEHGDDFAVAKGRFTVPCLVLASVKPMLGDLGIKFFAEIIHFNENFDNFIRSKHRLLFFSFVT
jgi:hypothetical protein